MGKEKTKKSGSKFHDYDRRFRWGILGTVAVLFSIILFPNLVITRHQYNLGDVAERDIKSPRDFFIEDQAATEINRRQSVDKVLTVYDYDSDLARVLTRNVEAAFAEMRVASDVQDSPETQKPASNDSSDEMTDAADNPSKSVMTDKRKYLEEKLGIRVNEGAYRALEKVGFSKEISDLINRILQEILSNGVVTNKEILLKESEKGIILRNVRTKKEQELQQLKKILWPRPGQNHGPDRWSTTAQRPGICSFEPRGGFRTTAHPAQHYLKPQRDPGAEKQNSRGNQTRSSQNQSR